MTPKSPTMMLMRNRAAKRIPYVKNRVDRSEIRVRVLCTCTVYTNIKKRVEVEIISLPPSPHHHRAFPPQEKKNNGRYYNYHTPTADLPSCHLCETLATTFSTCPSSATAIVVVIVIVIIDASGATRRSTGVRMSTAGRSDGIVDPYRG